MFINAKKFKKIVKHIKNYLCNEFLFIDKNGRKNLWLNERIACILKFVVFVTENLKNLEQDKITDDVLKLFVDNVFEVITIQPVLVDCFLKSTSRIRKLFCERYQKEYGDVPISVNVKKIVYLTSLKEQYAAERIQQFFRSYQRKKIFSKLLGKKNSLQNIEINFEEKLEGYETLSNYMLSMKKMSPKFATILQSKHFTSANTVVSILSDMALLSKKYILSVNAVSKNGISKSGDIERDDHGSIYTTYKFSYDRELSESNCFFVFNLAKMAQNQYDSVKYKFYFNLIDRGYAKLVKNIKLFDGVIFTISRNKREDKKLTFDFKYKDKTYNVYFPSAYETIYGLSNLKSYVIRLLINAVTRISCDELKKKILDNWNGQKDLIEYFNVIVDDMLHMCEICIPGRHDFKSLDEIERIVFKGKELIIQQLSNAIKVDDVKNFLEQMKEFTRFFTANKFVIECYKLANKYNAKNIINALTTHHDIPDKIKKEFNKELHIENYQPIKRVQMFLYQNGMEKVKGQKNNKGNLYRAKYNLDCRYYVKYYDNQERIYEEMVTYQLYKLCGVPVPEIFYIMDKNGNIGLASKEIVGRSLKTVSDYSKLQGLYSGAFVDIWLANWDAVGLEMDNIIVSGNKAIRIDFGSNLLYRAQGNPKEQSANVDDEFTNMYNVKINLQFSKTFHGFNRGNYKYGAKLLSTISDSKIAQVFHSYWPTENKFYLVNRRKYFALLLVRKKQFMDKYKAMPNLDKGKINLRSAKQNKSTLCKISRVISEKMIEQFTVNKMNFSEIKHGVLHSNRVLYLMQKLYLILKITYPEQTPELAQDELLQLSLIGLFHDFGRVLKNQDVGDDSKEMEQQGASEYYNFATKKLGYSESKAQKFADVICNKDNKMHHDFIRHILYIADVIEVFRSQSWKFDGKHLDIYQKYPKIKAVFDKLVVNHIELIGCHGDRRCEQQFNNKKYITNYVAEIKAKLEMNKDVLLEIFKQDHAITCNTISSKKKLTKADYHLTTATFMLMSQEIVKVMNQQIKIPGFRVKAKIQSLDRKTITKSANFGKLIISLTRVGKNELTKQNGLNKLQKHMNRNHNISDKNITISDNRLIINANPMTILSECYEKDRSDISFSTRNKMRK